MSPRSGQRQVVAGQRRLGSPKKVRGQMNSSPDSEVCCINSENKYDCVFLQTLLLPVSVSVCDWRRKAETWASAWRGVSAPAWRTDP